MKDKEELLAVSQLGTATVCEAKSNLRRLALTKRGGLDEITRQEFSRSIAKRIILSSIFGQSYTIHVYLSFGTETDTRELVTSAFAAGKQVATSIVLHGQQELSHAIISPETRFVEGIFGVPTPINVQLLTAEQLGLTNSDIIIVPLVAFDRNCNRLGYGKGYYDRFLAKTSARRVGIGFACQEASNIYTEPTDVSLDFIFTETDIIVR